MRRVISPTALDWQGFANVLQAAMSQLSAVTNHDSINDYPGFSFRGCLQRSQQNIPYVIIELHTLFVFQAGRPFWTIEQRDTISTGDVMFATYKDPHRMFKTQLTLDDSLCPPGLARHIGQEPLLGHMIRMGRHYGHGR